MTESGNTALLLSRTHLCGTREAQQVEDGARCHCQQSMLGFEDVWEGVQQAGVDHL